MIRNHGYAYRERIAAAGTALDHLVRQYRHSSEAAWRERIERGEVALDGLPVKVATALAPGQELVWQRPPWDEPEVDLDYQVLFEDEVLLAVVKPRGLPTLPGGGFLEHTLLHQVRLRFPAADPMHRLGRETSGLVLFARDHGAAGTLQAAWRGHRVDKRYRALGSGVCARDRFDVEAAIGPVPHPLLGSLHAASPGGRRALSHVLVLERNADSTLFQVDIETGRPHQIRIHLAWAGHPLAGDPLYGPGGLPLPDLTALPGDGGYRLHAERLGFVHPLSGAPMVLVAPPPEDLRTRAGA
jgi:23S rRNA pseudouridine1911/1915/1917 synthase